MKRPIYGSRCASYIGFIGILVIALMLSFVLPATPTSASEYTDAIAVHVDVGRTLDNHNINDICIKNFDLMRDDTGDTGASMIWLQRQLRYDRQRCTALAKRALIDYPATGAHVDWPSSTV